MQKSDFVAVKYLHQRFPILIAVLGHDNPQSMVLANFYYFWCELSFLLSWESCSSSPVSLEVFSPPQILLTVQTTTKSLSLPPPSFQVSGFWTLENTVLLMYSFLCFIFWFSMFLSVLLSAVSVLYVFLSFLFLFNCSYLFFLFFSALYLVQPFFLFYWSFCSLFCSLPFLFIHLFSDPSYCSLLKSAILSILFFFYSILSASSLCSSVQPVLFPLLFIFLEFFI